MYLEEEAIEKVFYDTMWDVNVIQDNPKGKLIEVIELYLSASSIFLSGL